MNILEEIEKRLSVFKNLYDGIRLVDPINKKVIKIEGSKIINEENNCFSLMNKDSFCKNCVAMRAYVENDTFVKIEYDNDKMVIVTASPVQIEDKIYIMEMYKDISKKGSISTKEKENESFTEHTFKDMQDKIIMDELTCVYNRRYINERLPIDLNKNSLTGAPISIIMADIDFFKNVNDNYGHLIGDKILKDFAALLSSSIREKNDWVGRYGGEEFIIVLNNTTPDKAFIVAEKLRKLLEKKIFNYKDLNIKITSSFGVHGISSSKSDMDSFIKNADNNLYEAKLAGRNKTIFREFL